MRVTTANVNGIRARAPQVEEWLERERPDVVCLQELKAELTQLPQIVQREDYHAFWHSCKGYSGVSLQLRKETFPEPPVYSHPPFDFESRVVTAELGDLVVASIYVPNGGKDYPGKIAFLERLIDHGPAINWALYMKTDPCDDRLFSLLKKSGASMVTISVPTGVDSITNAGGMIALAKKHGVSVAIDLLVGFPGDTFETVKNDIEAMRAVSPDTVGVNATLRLAPSLPVTQAIMVSETHRSHLLGRIVDNPDFIGYAPISLDQIVAIMRQKAKEEG